VRLWLMLASLYRETGEEDAAARAAAMAFRFAPRRRIRGADDGEQAPDASQAPPVEATVEGGPLTPEESPSPTPEVAPGE
jgi:hypothetical protein